jgi:hypothetical protein
LTVIVSGALLAVCGAVSLLFGFDIVMTERGAAMTLSGVIAISGGMITMAIGLALKQMGAIRRALEARAARPAPRLAGPERPVVPIAAAAPKSADPPGEASLLPAAGGIGLGAAAGAAAGALALSTVAAKAEPPAGAGDDLPVDLEAELSRALSTEAEKLASTGAPQADDWLQDALADPLIASIPSAPREPALLARDAGATPLDSIEVDEEPAESSVAEAIVAEDGIEPLSEDDADEHPASREERADDEEAVVVEAEGPEEEREEERPVASEEDGIIAIEGGDADPEDALAASLPEPEAAGNAEDGNAGQEEASDTPEASEQDVAEADADDMAADDMAADEPEEEAASAVTPARPAGPTPLGSYRAGGRSYTMYSDGTVEAVTEEGVERFGSMDELRRHLART